MEDKFPVKALASANSYPDRIVGKLDKGGRWAAIFDTAGRLGSFRADSLGAKNARLLDQLIKALLSID